MCICNGTGKPGSPTHAPEIVLHALRAAAKAGTARGGGAAPHQAPVRPPTPCPRPRPQPPLPGPADGVVHAVLSQGRVIAVAVAGGQLRAQAGGVGGGVAAEPVPEAAHAPQRLVAGVPVLPVRAGRGALAHAPHLHAPLPAPELCLLTGGLAACQTRLANTSSRKEFMPKLRNSTW